jgi:hypothetical protein
MGYSSRHWHYDLYELKLDFPSELESFMKDVSKFGVLYVTEKHCCTSLVKEVEMQAQIGKLTVVFLVSCGITPSLFSCEICACISTSLTRLVQQCFSVTYGNYEKDIVRFSGKPFEVSYTGENIVAVAIYNKHEIVFVNVITNIITNTVLVRRFRL